MKLSTIRKAIDNALLYVRLPEDEQQELKETLEQLKAIEKTAESYSCEGDDIGQEKVIILAEYSVFSMLADMGFYRNNCKGILKESLDGDGVHDVPDYLINDAEEHTEQLRAEVAEEDGYTKRFIQFTEHEISDLKDALADAIDDSELKGRPDLADRYRSIIATVDRMPMTGEELKEMLGE